jgi:stearoyl-CoA desaturase (delta-9 desaturase)
MFIRLLEALGLAWDVKVPAPGKIARRALPRTGSSEPDFEAG